MTLHMRLGTTSYALCARGVTRPMRMVVTYNRAAVTCKRCLKLLDEAERESKRNQFNAYHGAHEFDRFSR